MSVRVFVAAVSAAALGLSACNQGGDDAEAAALTAEEKLAVAREVAELQVTEEQMDDMFTGMAQQTASMLPDPATICAAPGVSVARQAECVTRLEGSGPQLQAAMEQAITDAKQVIPELVGDMAAAMVDVYSDAELVAMRDFYTSELGRAVTSKQDEVMEAYLPKVMARMQPMQMEMLGTMQTRVQEIASGVPAAPPPAGADAAPGQ